MKLLSGKIEEDFKEHIVKSKYFILNPKCQTIKWTDFPDIMKFELIKEFARSKGYYIDLQPCPCHFPPQYFINIITEDRTLLDVGDKEEYEYEAALYASIVEFKKLYNGIIKT
jgi:hypothetical protein